jgi:hypothetical protein
MKGYAQDFFASGRDPVFKLISDMQAADNNKAHLNPADRLAAIDAAAWQILKQVATERLTSAQGGTAAQGATFVNYVLGCTDIGVPDDFTTHAALILNSGIFEIRGGSSDNTYPALAFVKAEVGGARALATPRWGVQKGSANSWIPVTTPATPPYSYLVYGYPFKGASVTGVGAAAEINTNEVAPTGGRYNAFELGTVPDLKEQNVGLRVGLCVNAVVTGSSDVSLLFHSSEIQNNSSPSFCDPLVDPTTLVSLPSRNWYANFAQRVTSVFRPTTLFAQEEEGRFLGGLPSGWSPFHSGSFTPANVALIFTSPINTDGTIQDGFTTKARTFKVRVRNGTTADSPAAPAGVTVTLSIAGNNGSPALFLWNNVSSRTITTSTDASGDATFVDVKIIKAGGYLITASGSLGGLAATQSTTPPMFWIKNK